MGKLTLIMIGRDIARFDMDSGGSAIVATEEGEENFGEIAALGHADPAHNAKVHRPERTVCAQNKIALMHVSMKHAVVQCRCQKAASNRVSKLSPVRAVQCTGLGQRYALNPRRGQDASRCALPFNAGHFQIAISGDNLAKGIARTRFTAQVELLLQRSANGSDKGDRLEAAGFGDKGLDKLRSQGHSFAFSRDFLLNARPQQFDSHFASICQRHLMDLGDGGCSDNRT